jgi:hypothetical protein
LWYRRVTQSKIPCRNQNVGAGFPNQFRKLRLLENEASCSSENPWWANQINIAESLKVPAEARLHRQGCMHTRHCRQVGNNIMQVSKTRAGAGRKAIYEDPDHWNAARGICRIADCANWLSGITTTLMPEGSAPGKRNKSARMNAITHKNTER